MRACGHSCGALPQQGPPAAPPRQGKQDGRPLPHWMTPPLGVADTISRSEAGFEALSGVSLVPESSGKTTRHRLNRGGDPAANSTLHRRASAACSTPLAISGGAANLLPSYGALALIFPA